jgi:hypothetical protein
MPAKTGTEGSRHCVCGPGPPLPRGRWKKRRWEPSVWFIPAGSIRPSRPIGQVAVRQRFKLCRRRPAKWLSVRNIKHLRGALLSSDDAGQNRALASDPEEPHPVGKLLRAPISKVISRLSSTPTTTADAVDSRCASAARLTLTIGVGWLGEMNVNFLCTFLILVIS